MDRRAKALLKDKQWREVKDVVKKRDDGLCRPCVTRGRRTRGTQVHHLLYRSHGGKDDARNLILLCGKCHQDAHAKLLLITWGGKNPAKSVKFEWVKA